MKKPVTALSLVLVLCLLPGNLANATTKEPKQITGFQDAIYEPSQAIIDLKLDRFKFQLLMEYQTLIDKKTERLLKLKKLHLSTINIDPLLSEKLTTDIDIVQYDLEMMNGDYQLIDKREGKFKIIENSYKIGYTTGVISYKNSVILN
jgi:hypothetical protein